MVNDTVSGTSRERAFAQIDVFGAEPYRGNPVAVVLDGEGIGDDAMARFAAWTNLSETTFVLPPAAADADYRLRIFTPDGELPFAGHPTLGSAHAWLEAGGAPKQHGRLVQECGVGLVELTQAADRSLSFKAPEPIRTGPLDDTDLDRIAAALRISRDRVVDHQWVDNGPGWAAVRLASADDVLALDPDDTRMRELMVGAVGPHPDGAPERFEVRAFAGGAGIREDPVTGSLNASLGQWLIGSGVAPSSYLARQGTRVGRYGVISVEQRDGAVWVGGATRTCISGTVRL
jgi:PhzF family phenazine biosynthesis protein